MKILNDMKVKILLTLIIFAFFGFTVDAQEFVRVKKSEYQLSDDDDFKEAWKYLRKGNRKFRIEKKGAYAEALEYYLRANEYNEDHAGLNYLIGVCYLKTSDKRRSLEYLENAYFINEALPDILYWRGLAYKHNHEFEKAISDFEDYLFKLETRKLQKVKMKVDKHIEECKNGIELMEEPVRCFIDNLGSGINTEAPEYSPVFNLEDSVLYFTSRRENTTGGRRNHLNMMYYEDVYISNAQGGKWLDAEIAGKPINTKRNDAAVDLSPEGKEIAIYRGYKGNGNLYNSQYKDGKWGRMNKMRKINKRKYRESSVSVSKDSMTLYFVSDRKGGTGGQDIWYSYRTQDGAKWQKPEPLVKANTKYDEETVEISNNGKTLFFSSKGHKTMGGYDVFKITRNDDGTWNEPINIGYPINTPDDDVFFMLTPDEKFGYYAADRPDSYGDKDIYQVVFLGPKKPTKISEGASNEDIAFFMDPLTESDIEKPVNIKIVQLSLVKGVVTDAYSGKPVKAKLELVDNATGELVKEVESYEETGAYTVPLPPGKDYALTVGAPDYFFHSENFVVHDTAIHMVIKKDVQLQPMGIGAKIVLNNVFFDTGKATLRPESYPELLRLVRIMEQYPNLKIEISGHTDSKGSSSYNQRLSQKRAQSVVDYLTSQGVNLAQIQAKGYGEEQPRADNSTPEGRQLNRRVEAKILDK